MNKSVLARLCALVFAAAVSISCFDPMYYEPAFGDAGTVEIPVEGGDYYFWVTYEYVETKFEPGESYKAFKFRLMIDGELANWGLVENQSDLWAYWPAGVDYPDDSPEHYSQPVLFYVPENDKPAEREVLVDVAVDKYFDDEDKEHEWGEWTTVFRGVQNCRK